MRRLLNIDRRIIFAFVLLGVLVPLLIDFRFPITPSQTVRDAYEAVERVKAREGGVMLLCYSFGASTAPELQPMALALLRHAFQRGVPVVVMCLLPDAPGLAQQDLATTAAEYGRTYGRDYAFLGYKPGTSSVVLNMGQSFHDAFPLDAWGAATDTIPLTRNIGSLRDFGLVVDLASGDSIEYWWIPYGREKFGFPLAAGCTAVMAPDLYPFLQSGQLVGLVGGLAGAAEYEQLVDHPGQATAGMLAQSTTHVIIAAFILFGNAAYFVTRRRARGSVREGA